MELYLHSYLFYHGVDTVIFTVVFPTCNTVLSEPKPIGHVSETQRDSVPERYLEYREETCVFNIANNTRLGVLTIVVLLLQMYCLYSLMSPRFFNPLKEKVTSV